MESTVTQSAGSSCDVELRTRAVIALAVRDRLEFLQRERLQAAWRGTGPLADQLAKIESARRNLATCLARGWPAAAGKLVEHMRAVLPDVSYFVAGAERAIAESQPKLPAARDIIEELQQIEEEFGQVKLGAKAGTVSVVTEPIEFDDVYLGTFEICLRVDRITPINPQGSFSVIALDPHPASSNENVTHPHVSDERLCCGDASMPMRAALEAGRLGDFFCLARSVLETYNDSSPYISIADWEGRPCSDCGYSMAADEGYMCTSCEGDFCAECSSSCMRCEETTCSSCLTVCPVCGDGYCRECITICPDCEQTICLSCLEDGQCPCREEDQDQQEEQEDDNDHDDNEDCFAIADTTAGDAGPGQAEEAA